MTAAPMTKKKRKYTYYILFPSFLDVFCYLQQNHVRDHVRIVLFAVIKRKVHIKRKISITVWLCVVE